MNKRKLGSQGLVVSAEGLGCTGMSQSYGPADEQESLATIDRALELGIDFFDTAEVYGPYKNEELVGRSIGRSSWGSTSSTRPRFTGRTRTKSWSDDRSGARGGDRLLRHGRGLRAVQERRV